MRNLPATPSPSPYRTYQITPYVVGAGSSPAGTVRRPRTPRAASTGSSGSGGWGFCTDKERNPWWQVRLDGEMPLDRVLIYNTDTPGNVDLCRDFHVLLSDNGMHWKEAYRHDGKLFSGPKQPLTVPLKGAQDPLRADPVAADRVPDPGRD